MQPKKEKCIFVGYYEYVKGYILLQPHCNEIILRRDVKFDENLLACERNSAVVPSSACEPSLAFVPTFVPILASSLDDDSEDENPPPTSPLLLWGKSPYGLANRVQTLHVDMTEEKLLSTFIPRFKSPFLSKCKERSTYLIPNI